MAGSGEWLEAALVELSGRMEAGLSLDRDLIHGLVSFCEIAPPQDAADYLNVSTLCHILSLSLFFFFCLPFDPRAPKYLSFAIDVSNRSSLLVKLLEKNIVGQETGQPIIQEYMKRRGVVDSSAKTSDIKASSFKPYVKPPAEEDKIVAVKKQTRVSRETNASLIQDTINQNENEPRGASKGNSAVSKKKKSGRVITLAEAAKGTVVFQQGKPCSCQARRHKLVSNCLSCGKIVCEQEGEGPCNFCGALVLKEGSTYAGLSDMAVPLSEAEAAAEAYSKRLVEYDRNSAARTKVIDDQSDYYEIEGNSWLSAEEKQLIQKKKKEIEEADEARRGKVVVTFDLLGRKVILNKDEASDLDYGILRPSEERESNRIKPNPAVKLQPVLVETGARRVPAKGKPNIRMRKGLCLEISGRVQHDNNELLQLDADGVESASVSGAGAGVLAR